MRVPQTRGDLKDITRINLPQYFAFHRPAGERTQRISMIKNNRELYKQLTYKSTFMYEVCLQVFGLMLSTTCCI